MIIKYHLLILILLITLVPGVLFMSQIDYEFISLECLIQSSDAILLVKKQDPFEKIIELPLSEKYPHNYPLHRRALYQFTVLSVLYTIDTLEIEADIIVHRANEDTDLEMDRLYYVEGIEESPIFIAYNSEVDLYSADEFIIFVTHRAGTPGEYWFVVENAILPADDRDMVMKLIAGQEK